MQQTKVIPKSRSQLKQKIQTEAAPHKLLGYVCYWSMTAFRIPLADFKKHLEACEIDAKIYGKTVTEKSYANAAVKVQTKGLKKFHRKTEDKDNKRTVFAIINEQVDQAADFHHGQESKIAFDHETKSLQVQGTYKQEIENRYEQFKGTISTEQFRDRVLTFVKNTCNGISLNDTGGVYFVPISADADLQKLKKLFGFMTGCAIECWPIVDQDAIKQSMWKSVTADVQAKIANFNKELDEMQGKKLSAPVIQRRVDAYKKLNTVVSMYEGLLSGAAQELMSGIAGVQKRLSLTIQNTEIEE